MMRFSTPPEPRLFKFRGLWIRLFVNDCSRLADRAFDCRSFNRLSNRVSQPPTSDQPGLTGVLQATFFPLFFPLIAISR